MTNDPARKFLEALTEDEIDAALGVVTLAAFSAHIGQDEFLSMSNERLMRFSLEQGIPKRTLTIVWVYLLYAHTATDYLEHRVACSPLRKYIEAPQVRA